MINNTLFRASIGAVICFWMLSLTSESSGKPPSLPTNGTVTSQFGWRVDPFNGANRFHAGVDIAAPSGSPIRASQRAVVAYSGSYKGYGNVVALAHGQGLYTLYGHAAAVYVKPDQVVEQGQIIASVGSTGRSTGPHLHFEVHRRGQYQNPVVYLSNAVTQPPVSTAIHTKPELKKEMSTSRYRSQRSYARTNNPYTASTTVYLSQEALYENTD